MAYRKRNNRLPSFIMSETRIIVLQKKGTDNTTMTVKEIIRLIPRTGIQLNYESLMSGTLYFVLNVLIPKRFADGSVKVVM
jgi:hypothetical protein